MSNPRHLREPFRHARRRHTGRRIGRLPLVPAAAIGVAAVAALPSSQAISATTGGHADRAAVVDLSTALGRTTPGATPTAQATTAPTAKPSPAATKSTPTASKPTASKTAEPTPAAKLELNYKYAVQINGWYCGPAAARIALTARGLYPTQDELAAKLGTTVNGTNSSADIARVLNAMTKTSFYQATFLPSKSVTTKQINQLQSDVVDAISHGYALVMNVVGTGQDTNGNAYTFSGGHYIAAVGYQDNGRKVKIADSANGYTASYWMTVSNLAEWVGTRGYTS
jgi:Peptidase_C39 like family